MAPADIPGLALKAAAPDSLPEQLLRDRASFRLQYLPDQLVKARTAALHGVLEAPGACPGLISTVI